MKYLTNAEAGTAAVQLGATSGVPEETVASVARTGLVVATFIRLPLSGPFATPLSPVTRWGS
ncbi:MAG: hypothetical protein ACYYNF_05670 [Actinomycetes bacterium]